MITPAVSVLSAVEGLKIVALSPPCVLSYLGQGALILRERTVIMGAHIDV